MSATPSHILWGSVNESSSGNGSRSSDRTTSAPAAAGVDCTAVIGNRKVTYPSYVQFEEGSSSLSASQTLEWSIPQAKDCKEGPARPDQGAGSEAPASAAAAGPSQAASSSAAAGPRQPPLGRLSGHTVEMLTSIPRDENGRLSSLGALEHEAGTCKPCLFVHTRIGCQNGVRCDFCHLSHRRKSKPRPCKGKRDRYRKLILRAESEGVDYRGIMDEDLREIAAMTAQGQEQVQANGGEGEHGASGKSETEDTSVSVTVLSL